MSDKKQENKIKDLSSPSDLGASEKAVVGLVKTLTAPFSYISSLSLNLFSKSTKDNHSTVSQSTCVDSDEAKGIYIYRKLGFDKELSVVPENMKTICHIIKNSISKFANKNFLGTRVVYKEEVVKESNGRELKKLSMGPFHFITYAEAKIRIDALQGYFIKHGLRSHSKFAIFADTRSEWFLTCLSCMLLKVRVVTIYSTLSDDAILYALNLTRVTNIMVDKASFSRLMRIINDVPTIKHIYCSSDVDISVIEDFKEKFHSTAQFKNVSTVAYTTNPNKKGTKRNSMVVNSTEMKHSKKLSKMRKIRTFDDHTTTEFANQQKELSDDELFKLNIEETEFESDEMISDVEELDKEAFDSKKLINIHYIPFVYKVGEKIIHKDPLKEQTYDPEDVAMIMFTSGSTGLPKGVIIQHKNLCSTIIAGTIDTKYWDTELIYPAYLPLAHIFEFIAEVTMCAKGSTIGYCRPLTLTDTSPMVAEGSVGDFTELKPTLCIFVPILLERIKKGILDKIKERGKIGGALLQYGYNHKLKFRNSGGSTPAVNKIIFGKIKQLTGGRLKFALCGGAPLSGKTEEFINICFGIPVKQGYGLTETCSAGSLGNFDDISSDNTGPPLSNVDFRLDAWPEGGYSPTDKPNPRGEIWLSGDAITLGYYKRPDLTAEVFWTDPETGKRWFKTGDVGELLSNGTIKIIDRKKDIIKLKHGEYVSLVQIENTVVQSKYVEMVCALPNKDMDHIILIISSSLPAVKRLAESLNIPIEANIVELFENSEINKAVYDDIILMCKKGNLSKFDFPKSIHLAKELWLPDSGLVTPSMKIKRPEMGKFYSQYL